MVGNNFKISVENNEVIIIVRYAESICLKKANRKNKEKYAAPIPKVATIMCLMSPNMSSQMNDCYIFVIKFDGWKNVDIFMIFFADISMIHLLIQVVLIVKSKFFIRRGNR